MRFRLVILQQTRNSELAVLPVEEISLAPDPDADASAPEAPADSDDTNGTEAAAASDAPAQAPHTEAPAAAQLRGLATFRTRSGAMCVAYLVQLSLEDFSGICIISGIGTKAFRMGILCPCGALFSFCRG